MPGLKLNYISKRGHWCCNKVKSVYFHFRAQHAAIMVTLWHGHMFRTSYPLCGKPLIIGGSLAKKGQWYKAMIISLLSAWINFWKKIKTVNRKQAHIDADATSWWWYWCHVHRCMCTYALLMNNMSAYTFSLPRLKTMLTFVVSTNLFMCNPPHDCILM